MDCQCCPGENQPGGNQPVGFHLLPGWFPSFKNLNIMGYKMTHWEKIYFSKSKSILDSLNLLRKTT